MPNNNIIDIFQILNLYFDIHDFLEKCNKLDCEELLELKENIKINEEIKKIYYTIENFQEIIEEKEDNIYITKKEFKDKYENDLYSYIMPILKLSLELKKQSSSLENKKNKLRKSLL